MRTKLAGLGILAIAAFGQSLPSIQVIGPNWTTQNTSRAITIVGFNFNSGTTCTINYSNFGIAPSSAKGESARPEGAIVGGGVAFPCSVASANLITGTVPGTASVVTGALSVSNGGSLTTTTSFQSRATGSTSPALSSLSTSSRVMGSGSFSLDLAGTFVSGMNFFWVTPGSSPVQLTVNGTPTASAAQVTVPSSLLGRLSTSYIYGSTPALTSAPLTTALLPFTVVAPSISSLSVTSTPAGSASFSMNVNGSFPAPGPGVTPAAVSFTGPAGSANLTVTASSAAQLTVTVPGTSLTAAGAATVVASVFVSQAESSSSSNGAAFTITPPAPAISSVSPTPVAQGAAATTFTISGANFAPGSQSVTFTPPGGSATGVAILTAPGSTSMTVSVPPNLLTSTGTGTFQVSTGAGGSNAGAITIAAPAISGVTPASALKGAANTAISIAGSNFLVGGVPAVRFTPPGGSTVTLAFTGTPGGSSVGVTIPAAQLVNAGTATIVVQSGTASSAAFNFAINAPAITGLTPSSISQNSGTTNVIIAGSGFTLGSPLTATWIPPGGSPATGLAIVPTPGASSMTVTVPNTLLTAAGVAQIFVTAGTATSNSVNFTVTANAPALSSSNPANIAQSTATSITLTGSNLAPLSSITFTPPGGSPISLTPTAANATSITVALTSAQVPSAGSGVFTATTQTSPAATLSVQVAAPSITLQSPASIVKGASSAVVTLSGTFSVGGFAGVARWTSPSPGPTTDFALTFPTAGVATFTAGAAELANAGAATIRVVAGGAASNAVTIPIVEPVISSVSPASSVQTGAALPIAITGANFTAGGTPVVRFTPPGGSPSVLAINGTPNAGSISATITAGLLNAAGNASIQVQTGTATSAPATFAIGSGPAITSLSQASAVAGSAQISPLVITGSNFTSAGTPTAFWQPASGSPVALANTAAPSATSMSVTVPASLLAAAGSASIFVRSGASSDSAPVAFAISAGPSISFLSPAAEFSGAPDLVVFIGGSGFAAGGPPSVRWTNGTNIQTLAISGTPSNTAINAVVPAALLAFAGSANIVVQAGGVNSAPASFTILPSPVITSLTPPSATAGGPGFTLTVNGANFAQSGYSATVRFNTTTLNPLTVAGNAITVNVSAALIATAGSYPVTVSLTAISQSAPLSQSRRDSASRRAASELITVSNTVNFLVNGAAPALSSLSPNAVTAGGAAFSLAIAGAGFNSGDIVDFNGTSVTPSSITASQIVAPVPAAAIAAPGVKNVRVLTSAGLPSNALPLRANYSITSLSPSFATAGGSAFPLTVSATALLSGAQIVFNGTTLQTLSSNATSVTANVPASLIATAAIVAVSVTDGALTSNSLSFSILGPVNITSINPAFAQAGGAAFSMAVVGSGFDSGTTALANGTPVTTSFQNSGQLTASIPASAIAAAGNVAITARDSNGRVSNEVTLRVLAPIVLTSLNPSFAQAGGAALTLTLIGSGFGDDNAVLANGSPLTTSFASASQLTATVPAALLAAPGSISFTVRDSNGRASNAVALPVLGGLSISNLNPTFAAVGSAPLNLTVVGGGFDEGSTVLANGSPLASVFVNATQMTATVPPTLTAAPGSISITVRDSRGRVSNAIALPVLGGLSITSLSPAFAQAGGATFTLTVNGANFDSGSAVLANGSPLSASFGGPTLMTAVVPASLIAAPGSLSITVRDSNQRVSNAIALPVLGALTISNLNPSFAAAGSAALNLTVVGGGFDEGTTVLANGSPLAGSFVNSSQMTATVPPSLTAVPGSISITARDSRGRVSNAIALPVLSGLTVTSLSPSFREAGSAAFTLTVSGGGFDDGSVVLANGSTTLSTAFSSAAQLTATVPAALLTSPGSLSISVRDSRSRASNAVALPVLAPILISALSPNVRDAGSAAFTLTVSGSGYESVSVVSFNGSALSTTFVSGNQLTAAVPASLIASASTVSVTVGDNRGRASAPAAFSIVTPLSITSLSPSFVEAGTATFTLSLNGAGFANGMIVLFGGNSIAATVLNSTLATAQIPAALVTSAGAVPVSAQIANSVFQPESPGVRASNSVNFNVLAPLQISGLNPSRANAGVPPFTLSVSGQGFTSGAVIRFNNSNLATTFVNSGALTAAVTVANPGAVEVRVQLTDGRISAPLPFTILPQLRISQINPPAAAAGANTFTLTVTGEGFTSESVVRIGGFGLPTTFISSTQLTAIVNDSVVANPITADITVANPLNAVSNAVSFSAGGTISITSINPPGAAAGTIGLSLAVSGTGFSSNTVVRFGTTDLATTFVGPTQLNATIPAALLATPGNFAITAASGSAVSNAVNFEVGGKPELTFINPDAVTAGSRGITIIALGRGFLPGATIRFGDDDIPTAFASGTQVSGVVGAALLAAARTVAVTVVNANGQASNSKEFRIAALTLVSLAPDKATAGGAAFSIAVEGTGFISGAIVSFGGRQLITSFGGATRLAAQVPADALVNAGRVNVTVGNPDGASSNALPFTIESDLPTISRINPNSVVAGAGEVAIAVTGGGFVRGSSVTANGNGLATTFNSATSLDATVPADLTLAIRNLVIKVVNPGGKESNELGLAVTAPTPAITSVNPASVNAGSTVDVSISIAGSGFIQGSSVTFNGAAIETSFNSATSLTAVIPAASLVNSGNAPVQVVNPGNLQSNVVQLSILGAVTVTSVNPATLSAGGAADPVIAVTGAGFVNGSTVQFGGAALATTFASATQLSATVPQNLLTTARAVSVTVRNPNGAVSNGASLQVTAAIPAITLNLPATITPAGNGRVQVTLTSPAPVDLQGTLAMTFANNSSNAPNGYVDPALAFAGAAAGQPRTISFSIAQGSSVAILANDGAFSPGTVAGTITMTIVSLTGGGQNLLPNPAPTRDIVVDRAAPVIVSGSVRITNIAGGFQVQLSGISSPRDLRSVTYTFTAAGASILEGASVTVDAAQLFTAFFASDAGRAAGGTFGFTMPFTVSGGDAAAVTQVSVTLTNSVGVSQAVAGGR